MCHCMQVNIVSKYTSVLASDMASFFDTEADQYRQASKSTAAFTMSSKTDDQMSHSYSPDDSTTITDCSETTDIQGTATVSRCHWVQ